MSNTLDPMVYRLHGIIQARILERVAFPFSNGSSNPGIEPRSPTLQVDSLPAEPQGKPYYNINRIFCKRETKYILSSLN